MLAIILVVIVFTIIIFLLKRKKNKSPTYKNVSGEHWMFILQVPSKVDDDTALCIGKCLSDAYWDAWGICEDIYEIQQDPPMLGRVLLIPKAEWEDKNHPVIRMLVNARPLIDICYPMLHGYDMCHLFAGEMHNLYRIGLGWPIYCRNDNNEQRKIRCLMVLDKLKEVFLPEP